MAGSRRTFALVAILAACSQSPKPEAKPASEPDPLVPLRAFEQERRAQAKFVETESSARSFGADPYDLVALADGRFAGIFCGRDAVVLLDESLAETARIPAGRSPSAIAVYEGPTRGALRSGDLLVASEIAPAIAHIRDGRRLADIPLPGVSGARAIAITKNGTIHVVEEHDDSLITLGSDHKTRKLPLGPIRIAKTATGIVVASATGHALTVVDDDGKIVDTKIDGPFWSVAAQDVDAGTIIVAGGAEDHPLDRREGFFGFVDSFVYVYFRAKGSRELVRIAAINSSEHHVVMPKAVAFTDATHATVAGYASARMLHLAWTHGPSAPPEVSTSNGVPGTSALVAAPRALIAANPLADAWIAFDAGGAETRPRVVHVADDRPTPPRVRLGEALFFSELMAPANKTDGALSRFTCETCHFEGYVDGRVHHTGRGDVHATTKPLLGLFNNRPHFSRALDPDLSAVAENEFRVAGAHSGTDPHFAIDSADPKLDWLGALRLDKTTYTSVELRLAFMDFLMAFSHRPNPRAVMARSFSSIERKGAEAFRDKCEGCHQARSAADVASSRVPFEQWEPLVLSERGPLVWGSDGYHQTGVVPYVHENGARTPSLRRLYKKRPYFTNGSAPDIETVLSRVRFMGSETKHDGTTEGTALDRETIQSLEAFLDLL